MSYSGISLFATLVSLAVSVTATLFGVNDKEKEFTMAVAIAGAVAAIIAATARIIFDCIGM